MGLCFPFSGWWKSPSPHLHVAVAACDGWQVAFSASAVCCVQSLGASLCCLRVCTELAQAPLSFFLRALVLGGLWSNQHLLQDSEGEAGGGRQRPWQVSILLLGTYICSSSLIHCQGILTAALCLQRSVRVASWLQGLGFLTLGGPWQIWGSGSMSLAGWPCAQPVSLQ